MKNLIQDFVTHFSCHGGIKSKLNFGDIIAQFWIGIGDAISAFSTLIVLHGDDITDFNDEAHKPYSRDTCTPLKGSEA